MPTYLQQQKPPFGSLRTDNHWSVKDLQFYSFFRPNQRLIDESGFGNHGTIFGPEWVGQGLHFIGGNNDHVNLGTPASLQFINSSFTIIAWINKTNADTTEVILGNALAGVAPEGWGFLTRTTGTGNLYCYINNVWKESNAGSFPHSGTWHQVAISFIASSTVGTFYVDGVDVGSDTWGTTITDAEANDIVIGVDPRDQIGNAFTGSVGNVILYDRDLNASEIQALYHNPNLPTEQDPFLPYFEEEVGGIVVLRRRRECA